MGIFEDQASDKSDWTDQDLLTIDEADERLAHLESSLVEEVDSAVDDTTRAAVEKRLTAVRRIRERNGRRP